MRVKQFLSLLPILAAIFFAACSKKISTDTAIAPVYTPNIIYSCTNGKILALNAATGVKAWEFIDKTATTNTEYRNNITIGWDSLGFVHANDFKLICFNTKTGKFIRETYGFPSTAPMAYLNNTLYVLTTQDSIFKLDQNFNIIWRNYMQTATADKWAPLVRGNKLYMGNSQGKLVCFDLNLASKTAPIWTANLGGDLAANATYYNGYIYCTAVGNKLVKVNDTNGSVKWTATLPSAIKSAPIVYGDMVAIGCDNFKIYSIDAISGNSVARWEYKTEDRVVAGAAIDASSESVSIGSNDFNVYNISHVTGKLRWKYPTASLVNTDVVAYDGNLHFSSMDKYAYCVNAQTGKLAWKTNLNNIPIASPVVCTYAAENIYPAVSGMSAH